MYNIFIYLYCLGVRIASLFSKKVKTMYDGEQQTFSILEQKLEKGARYLWFHAASLGEFEQGRPIMERIREEHPEYKIVLTFFSPSGYEVRKNYEGADIICYLPLDTAGNARKFIEMVKPEQAFFIKYEFWNNYLRTLKLKGIPVYSVSSIFRPEQSFFRFGGGRYAKVLTNFKRLFVQNEESKQLLNGIGIDYVDVVGDTRFDRVLQIKAAAKQLPIVEAFAAGNSAASPSPWERVGERLFVAGSSWQPDEEIFIPFFNQHKDWKMIIAPHVIGEEHLKQIMKLLAGRKVVRYTQATEENVRDAEVLIIDCFGLLSSIYNYGNVSYVGGGFGVGIHNTLEAAVWNIPVIFGPNNKKFREAQGLLREKGGFEITNAADFESIMTKFINDKQALEEAGNKAGQYVQSLAGATEKILNKLSLTP